MQRTRFDFDVITGSPPLRSPPPPPIPPHPPAPHLGPSPTSRADTSQSDPRQDKGAEE